MPSSLQVGLAGPTETIHEVVGGVVARDMLDMREWLRDCAESGTFRDLDGDSVDDLTDGEVIRGIERWYDGGIRAFYGGVG